MSTGVIAGLIWLAVAVHRQWTAAMMVALLAPIPMARHPNVTRGEEFIGYSR